MSSIALGSGDAAVLLILMFWEKELTLTSKVKVKIKVEVKAEVKAEVEGLDFIQCF
jgi:hypothetical protein